MAVLVSAFLGFLDPSAPGQFSGCAGIQTWAIKFKHLLALVGAKSTSEKRFAPVLKRVAKRVAGVTGDGSHEGRAQLNKERRVAGLGRSSMT